MTEEEYIIVTQLTALNLTYEALIEAGPPTINGLMPEDEYQQVMKTIHNWISDGFKKTSTMFKE